MKFLLLVCLGISACLVTALPAANSNKDDALQMSLTSDLLEALTNHDFDLAKKIFSRVHLDATSFKIAKSIKRIVDSDHFQNLSADEKRIVNELKESLPKSVKNAVFASQICLLNVDSYEYLFAPNDDYVFDADSRNVFLWRVGGLVIGSNWTLTNTITENDYRIVNIYGEDLFADNSLYYLNRRQVFTYRPAEWQGVSSNIWTLEPNGDYVTLRNTWYSQSRPYYEYLYAPSSVYNYDRNRGRVFTWDSNWNGNDLSQLWAIEDCSL